MEMHMEDTGTANIAGPPPPAAPPGVAAAPPAAAPPGVAAARRANSRAVGRRVNRRTTVGAVARPDVVVVRADAAPVPARIRRSNYAQEETDNLLDLLEDHLPIGQKEWIAVAAAHADRFPGKNRDYNALRRKYNEFVNCKKPTGDPDCPEHIVAQGQTDLLSDYCKVGCWDRSSD